MDFLVWILALAGAAAVAIAVVRRRKLRKAVALEEAKRKALVDDQRRILDLRVDDAIEYFGETWLVDGALLYDEEGVVWKTYLLGGAEDGKDRWLSVDDDDRIEIGLYEVLPPGSVEVPDEPPRHLRIGEVDFHLVERGEARVRKRDRDGTRDRGGCRYADYESGDGSLLSVEWWGDTVEVAAGKKIEQDQLLILPGS